MSDRRKLMEEAISSIAIGTCNHCARVASGYIVDDRSNYPQRWFFLSRASACVHLSAEDRALASTATSGSSGSSGSSSRIPKVGNDEK